MLNDTKKRKDIKHGLVIIIISILFFAFLHYFSNIQKPELVNRKGTSYEKAVVTEILQDNIQEDGSRIGYQKVKVKILSGKLKGQIKEATSFAGSPGLRSTKSALISFPVIFLASSSISFTEIPFSLPRFTVIDSFFSAIYSKALT